jgi:flavodoxin
MKIQSLKLAYFSPTGTTKSIVQAIAHGINLNTVEQIDITKPVTCPHCLYHSQS